MRNFFKKNNNLTLMLFLIILAVGLFVRFYRFPERISLDSDSGRDAFVAWVGAKDLQLPLIGPFSSIAPMVYGPWYWWQIIFATIFIPSKLAPWLYLGILSTLLILVAYRIGKLLGGKGLGLLMSLVAALSPIQITYGHWLTTHALIGFFASLTVLFFLRIIKEKQTKFNLILFGLFLGITVNMHFQATGLIVLLLFLLFSGRNNLKNFFISSFVFLLTFIPLLFFELTNHWYDIRHLLDYLQVGQYRIWTSVRWLTYAFNFWPNFWSDTVGGNYYSSLFFMSFTAILMIWRFFKKTLPKELILLGISFIIQIIIIRYFRGEKYYSYLNFFHPYLFIFTATVLYFFFSLKPKFLFGGIAVLVYLFLVFPSIKTNFFQGFEVQIRKDTETRIASILNHTKKNKFTLYRCSQYDPIYGKALLGLSYLQNHIDEKSEHKIGYYNGDCSFPETKETAILRLKGNKIDYHNYFPKIGDQIVDLSKASESAILEAKWVSWTLDLEYQEAARWWLTEQP